MLLSMHNGAKIYKRQKSERAKKKIEGEFRATKTRLDEESATKTQQENLTQRLEEEIAKLKEDLDKATKENENIERVCRIPYSLEIVLMCVFLKNIY